MNAAAESGVAALARALGDYSTVSRGGTAFWDGTPRKMPCAQRVGADRNQKAVTPNAGVGPSGDCVDTVLTRGPSAGFGASERPCCTPWAVQSGARRAALRPRASSHQWRHGRGPLRCGALCVRAPRGPLRARSAEITPHRGGLALRAPDCDSHDRTARAARATAAMGVPVTTPRPAPLPTWRWANGQPGSGYRASAAARCCPRSVCETQVGAALPPAAPPPPPPAILTQLINLCIAMRGISRAFAQPRRAARGSRPWRVLGAGGRRVRARRCGDKQISTTK